MKWLCLTYASSWTLDSTSSDEACLYAKLLGSGDRGIVHVQVLRKAEASSQVILRQWMIGVEVGLTQCTASGMPWTSQEGRSDNLPHS